MTIDKTFALAFDNHQKNNLEVAESLYNEVLKIDPNHVITHYNLGVIFKKLGNHQKSIISFEKVIEINPGYIKAYNNLGIAFVFLANYQRGKYYFEKTIEINPHHVEALHNLGVILNYLDCPQKAKYYFEKVIEINPNYIDAHINLGKTLHVLGEHSKAFNCFNNALEINPKSTQAYWNLLSYASNIDEALIVLKKLYKIDKKDIKANIIISALEGCKGNFIRFNDLLDSPESNHEFTRSIEWVFSLPKLPKILFNRWDFFDAIIELTDNSRPFYEFGVWNGVSFQYLINTFKRGFGFDTFSGLPEAWHNESTGTYSSFGSIPKIKGGEFIVGKFEDTLPGFFSKERPMASLINFDADLYSSTLCALNYSNKVIDEKTILIFDELIMNKNWEQDEFKALNDFCDNLGFDYDVLAISFFTKQVAVKLKIKK